MIKTLRQNFILIILFFLMIYFFFSVNGMMGGLKWIGIMYSVIFPIVFFYNNPLFGRLASFDDPQAEDHEPDMLDNWLFWGVGVALFLLFFFVFVGTAKAFAITYAIGGIVTILLYNLAIQGVRRLG